MSRAYASRWWLGAGTFVLGVMGVVGSLWISSESDLNARERHVEELGRWNQAPAATLPTASPQSETGVHPATRAAILREKLRRLQTTREDPTEGFEQPAQASATDRKRVGEATAGVLQHLADDLAPLVSRCWEDLGGDVQGMIHLQLNILGDPELGAVIDRVEIAAESEIDREDAAECVQQAALALAFDGASLSGRIEMTAPFFFGPTPTPGESASEPSRESRPAESRSPTDPLQALADE